MHRTRYRNKHTADRYEKRVRGPAATGYTQLRSVPVSRPDIATAVALPMAHAQGEFRSETRPDGGAARGRGAGLPAAGGHRRDGPGRGRPRVRTAHRQAHTSTQPTRTERERTLLKVMYR